MINDIQTFSSTDVRQGWDKLCEQVVFLYQLPPQVKQEVGDFFIDLLWSTKYGDGTVSLPQEPLIVEPIIKQSDEDNGTTTDSALVTNDITDNSDSDVEKTS